MPYRTDHHTIHMGPLGEERRQQALALAAAAVAGAALLPLWRAVRGRLSACLVRAHVVTRRRPVT